MKRIIFCFCMALCLLLCACAEGGTIEETAPAQQIPETTAKTTYTHVSVLGLSVDLPINSAFQMDNYEYANEATLAVVLNEAELTPTVTWEADECEGFYIIAQYVGTRVDLYEILDEDETGRRTYSDEPVYSTTVEDGCVIYAALERPKETAKWYVEVVVAENEYGGMALVNDAEDEIAPIEYIEGSSYIYYTSDDELQECLKPVIYLYPEEETQVLVQLDYQGELTCTYPAYEDGWTVTAQPDGTLTDENGLCYNYLYWEGKGPADYDFSTGFCIKGEDTAAFLETALEKLGLNRREANEFIVFWLPRMQENPYNIISFQTEAYTKTAPLTITPTPDTLLRVYMAYYGSQMPLEIAPQSLNSPERSGFVAVEWGGCELK